jgi:hypothetical protein
LVAGTTSRSASADDVTPPTTSTSAMADDDDDDDDDDDNNNDGGVRGVASAASPQPSRWGRTNSTTPPRSSPIRPHLDGRPLFPPCPPRADRPGPR